LVHASRLAVVGELTAMIAHEVNQPLNAILNNSEVAETLFALGNIPLNEIRNIIADIHNDGLRATKAIGRVRDLVQKRKMQVHTLDINALITEVVKIVSPDATRRHVQIRMEFSSVLPVMLGDPVRLQQVLLNLILNGMDAMNDVDSQRRILTLQTASADDGRVIVSVRDSGHGLSMDALPRIFESFYSTKAEGMGLGLSVARSIVEEHRGRIWAESNSDGGATIHFALPSGDWRKGFST
jgi:Signal transduction histidine kinase regulating C4-dicarboxylate transport system